MSPSASRHSTKSCQIDPFLLIYRFSFPLKEERMPETLSWSAMDKLVDQLCSSKKLVGCDDIMAITDSGARKTSSTVQDKKVLLVHDLYNLEADDLSDPHRKIKTSSVSSHHPHNKDHTHTKLACF